MNSISHAGAFHEFSTVDELIALPMVKAFTDDPTVSHFAQGDGQLLACKTIEGKPVWHLVGALAQPVILPASISGSSQPANHLGESK